LDTLITVFSLTGIGLGIASMLRRQHKALRYGFYVAILGANALRIVRSTGRGEPVAAFDTLTCAFLVTAILVDLIGARRSAKR
jgi:hypothetical protein